MRLLSIRPDHGRGGVAQEQPQAERQGHRRGDDQYLPLRHLSAHPRGRPCGGRRRHHRSRRLAMSTTNFEENTTLSRRSFIVGSAAIAGGGLGLGLNVPFTEEAQAKSAQAAAEVNLWVAIKPDDTCVIRIA